MLLTVDDLSFALCTFGSVLVGVFVAFALVLGVLVFEDALLFLIVFGVMFLGLRFLLRSFNIFSR